MTRAIEHIHGWHVHTRRVRVLADHLAPLLPSHDGARVLDVGCGDGQIDRLITERTQSRIAIEGIDVLVRQDARIPVKPFNGSVIPHPDASFDAVMFVDVLHHTNDPLTLLREALRVTKPDGAIVLKDHTMNGPLARATLRFMDRVGNARHGVVLPYNYWTKQQWLNALDSLDLKIETWIKNVGLYPFPANLIFGRSLHFVAKLVRATG